MIQRSRAERTTVHGAISAAFLLTLTQQDVSSDAMFTPGQCAIAAILADARWSWTLFLLVYDESLHAAGSRILGCGAIGEISTLSH
ncbi:hypothetical protein H6G00_19170 [Leptolyngbya sp. FACHB-541]|nr:hypothetical protein [Leptolyngbya sp. FACHB-541]MBD1998720.1 hypothetical protein [Leptolyngbya sp. FACHB-541]